MFDHIIAPYDEPGLLGCVVIILLNKILQAVYLCCPNTYCEIKTYFQQKNNLQKLPPKEQYRKNVY